MSLYSFSLNPFDHSEPENFGVAGVISRDSSLHVRFTLAGSLEHLSIPPPADYPQRRDDLWKESCFEFFFAEVGSEAYWEVNLSPSGHWNVYHFDSYREGMRREEKVVSLLCHIDSTPQSFTLEVVLDLGSMCPMDKPLHAGISAVLLSKNGNLSFWALAHPCGNPDFHDRKGFLLTL